MPNNKDKIKCIIKINNKKISFSFDNKMNIKDIKNQILKKYENDEDKKSEQNKSFDHKNQIRKEQILNDSMEKNLSKSINEEESKLIKKNNNYYTEKKKNKYDKKETSSINSETSNTQRGNHTKINLFYKGKEIINDDEIIGNLLSNNGSEDLELSAIILYLNESTFVDENKTKEKFIRKVTEKCQYHKNNKELFICTTCGVAFCQHCADKHDNHDIIERKNIIKFNNELKILNEELNKSLTESNLSNIYEIKENKNTSYNNNIEKLQNRLDNIKKMHKGIINNYKRDLDKSLPYLLEYKEKIEQLIESSYDLDTIKDDQQFMDYYYWYSNIKQKNIKIKQEIQNLQKNRELFNKLLQDFDEIIQNIHKKTDNDYKMIKKFYYNYSNENENQFRNINSDIKNNNNQNNQNQNNKNTPKLNLLYLLNQNEGFKNNIKNILKKEKSNEIPKEINKLSEISSINDKEKLSMDKIIMTNTNTYNNCNNKIINNKYNTVKLKETNKRINRKRFYSQKLSNKILGDFEEIEEKSEKEDDSQDEVTLIYPKYIYNIKPKSQNIYYFNFETKEVNEITVNFNNLTIESFEQYHSTLNYENNFYFSGGYNSSKVFCKYNQRENIFIPLKEMPTPHSYHGMLGMNNYIFIISGFKTKNVEKYDINNDTWESLADLNDSRSWPSCFGYKNKYIFVFGGLCHNIANENNILIEKLDISDIHKKWENFNFSYDNKIKLPYYFGLLHINENSFILVGGKYNNKENNMNDTYRIIIDDNNINIKKDTEFKLGKKEEFNGKMFTNLGNNYFGEFSSYSYGNFYLFNSLNKTIEEIN